MSRRYFSEPRRVAFRYALSVHMLPGERFGREGPATNPVSAVRDSARVAVAALAVLAGAALAVPAPATGAPGDLDRSFAGGVASRVVSSVRARQGGPVDVVRAGRTRVVVGNLYTCDGRGEEDCALPASGVLVGFLANGRRDRRFGVDGVVRLPRRLGELGRRAGAAGIATTPRGGIVLAGHGELDRGGPRLAVYTPRGRPDRRFGVRGEVRIPREVAGVGDLGGVAVDPTGRIAAIGVDCEHGAMSEMSRTSVLVVGPDGRRDSQFGSRGIARLEGDVACGENRVAFQRDGRLLVVGQRSGDDTVTISRLNRDGSLDRSFGSAGAADPVPGAPAAVAVSRGGSIAVSTRSGDDVRPRNAVAVFRPDGRLDAGFGERGLVRQAGEAFEDLEIDSRGRVVGRRPSVRRSLPMQRFSRTGRRDTAFERRARRSLAALFTGGRFASYESGLMLAGDRVYLTGTVDTRARPTRFALAALRY